MPLLNEMDKVYTGTVVLDAIYQGANKIWPSGSAPVSALTNYGQGGDWVAKGWGKSGYALADNSSSKSLPTGVTFATTGARYTWAQPYAHSSAMRLPPPDANSGQFCWYAYPVMDYTFTFAQSWSGTLRVYCMSTSNDDRWERLEMFLNGASKNSIELHPTNPATWFGSGTVATAMLPGGRWIGWDVNMKAGDVLKLTVTDLGSTSGNAVVSGFTFDPPASWTPASITGLVVWLDATQVTPVGQEVQAWTNLGSGPQPVISTPYPMTGIYTLNGKRLVSTNVNQGHIRFNSTGVSTNFTFVYLARLRAGNARVLNAIYPTGGNFLFGYHGGAMNTAYDGQWFTPNMTTTNDGSWHLYSGDKNGPGALPRMFSNGAYVSTGSGGDSFGGTLALSGYDPTGPPETGDIDFAEVILYDHQLSDAERQQVENYLTAKWITPPYDPDTSAYLAATGLDASYAPALDALVVGLKDKGLWTKMKAIYPFIGGTAALHKWNLKDPRDLDAAYRLTFTGGAHSTALGYRANAQGAGVGSSQYANTHFIPLGTLNQDSTHLAFYSTENTPSMDRAEMGCFNWTGTSGSRFHIIARYQGVNAYYYGMSEEGTSNVGVPAADGLFVATRTSVALQTAYRNGVSIATSGNGSIALPPTKVYIGAINEFANRSDIPCGFASIGDGLTAQNVTDLYTVVQAYQTALGRAV